MCHQTVCLIARHLEANGIATVCVASALDIIKAGRPPRAVFVDYPLGHTVGRPFDPDNQRAVVRGALSAFEAITTPGDIMPLNIRWSDSNDWKNEMGENNTGDTRAPRDSTPQYQTDEDRIAAER
ncbi:MAG: hypothetical protein E2O35_01180 [Proteobacteria bacterium]|nr:MAG: hypothetical protein E2O35_01180 [Pseudomonadota bacterium]